MKLRISQPGQPEQVIDVPGDAATLGRSAGCDVFVNHPYVSKRHAKVLRGVVIVDLGSCNGTFIEGERVREATLLPQGKLELGHEEVCIEIEGDPGDPLEFGIDATIPNHVPLEQIARGKDTVAPEDDSLRDERDRLDVEVRRLRKELAERGDGADAGELARLRNENEDLHRRLRSYKEEVEERAQDDAGSVGARLAMERSRELSVENEALQMKVQRLETELAKAHGSNGEEWAEEVERLRAENADQARQVAEVQEEIAKARKSLDRPSDDAAAAPAVGASELFQRLQRDNRKLQERVRELEQASAPSQAPNELFVDLQTENDRLRARIDALQTEIGRLRDDLATEKKATTHSEARPLPLTAPAQGVGRMLQQLVDDDAEDLAPLYTGTVEEFLVLELFRFVRQVEKCVTRVAGDLIQLFDARTVIPGMEGNYRTYASEVLLDPGETVPREELTRYLEELRKWLVAGLGSYRKAAVRFADGLRTDLSEQGLTASDPIPAHKKFTGQGDAELWRRVRLYVGELSPDKVEERVDKLARDSAQIILRAPDLEL